MRLDNGFYQSNSSMTTPVAHAWQNEINAESGDSARGRIKILRSIIIGMTLLYMELPQRLIIIPT